VTILRDVSQRQKCRHSASVAAFAVKDWEELDVLSERVDDDDYISEVLRDIHGADRVNRDSMHWLQSR